MRILCTGDIHLGRNPSRIPADRFPDQSAFSTRSIWKRIVDLAIDEHVDALLISGDLVDRQNRYFEALGPVEAGLERLADARIPVVAVAGNHDFDVLPGLTDRLGEKFRLLGRGQHWERLTLNDRAGRPALHVVGWSFAREHVTHDPLAAWNLEELRDLPTVGLLHTDLDRAKSRYAPTKLSDLRAMPVDAWLIGHIHARAHHVSPGTPPVLYPGSPLPLDPGETGTHGVWMLEITPNAPARFTSLPISSLEYRLKNVDVTGISDPIDAGHRVFDALTADAQAVLASADGLEQKLLLYRVNASGRASFPNGRSLNFDELMMLGGDTWAIEQVDSNIRPAIDLEQLASEASPPGVVARLIQSLERDEYPPEMLDRANAAIERESKSSQFAKIDDVALADPKHLLESVAWELLEAFIAQQEPRS